MSILYLHGLGMEPGGTKPTFLRSLDIDVIEPALPHGDFDKSVQIAQETFDRYRPDLVVGSSRGGAVAMALELKRTPLVLVAPAWKKWGCCATVKNGTAILHSQLDAVIPVQDSQELVRNSDLPESTLIAVGEDHFMVDEAALAELEAVVRSVETVFSRTSKKSKPWAANAVSAAGYVDH